MSFQALLDSIVSDDLRTVARHWQAARGDRFMPAWRDIDAAEIGPQLRYVWAWRYHGATGTFTGRLAGEDIAVIFSRSMHGIAMRDYFPPEIYRIFFPWMQRVVVEPAFARGSGLIYRRMGRNFEGERIILPLAEDGRTGDGLIGATVYNPVGGEMREEQPHFSGDEQMRFFSLDSAV
jgi:hypothetical protein